MIRTLCTICKKRFLIYLVFLLTFFGAVLTPHAEIYRWQDKDGSIQYSNVPPEDESLILDVIPTEKIPIIEDENGTVFYLNVPVGTFNKNIPVQEVLDQVTLAPEVLDELLANTSAKPVQTPGAASLDVTALAVRLTELEGALKQEMTKGLERQQEYLKSKTYANDLEQQNKTLKLALVQMEAKIDKLQKAVSVTDIHISALQDPQQQLGTLERKVGTLQAYVDNKTKQTDQNITLVQNSLYAKLDSVESDITAIQKLALPEKLAALSKELQTPQLQPQAEYNDSEIQLRLANLQATHSKQLEALYARLQEIDTTKSTYDQQLRTLSTRLNAFESEITSTNDADLSLQLNMLSKKLETLETQPQPDYNIRVKLASLETEVENLVDVLPASQSASKVVAELLESGNALRNIAAYQAQQIKGQSSQIEILKKEIDLLKTHTATPTVGQISETTLQNRISVRSISESDVPGLEEMMEKNAFMEAVIKHQTNALNIQKNRLNAIETRLEQLSFHIPEVTAEDVVDGADLLSGISGSRITVVPRKERRDTGISGRFRFLFYK